MPASYRNAVSQFVTLVIQQRDDLCAALREDAADAETQRRIRNFGQVAGRFPSGKTTLLIAEFEPRDGFGAVAKAFHAANAAVGTAGVGAYFLPMLKAVNDAQRDLYLIVRKAFEDSRYQVFGELQEHAQAVCELWDAVGGNELDQLEETPPDKMNGTPGYLGLIVTDDCMVSRAGEKYAHVQPIKLTGDAEWPMFLAVYRKAGDELLKGELAKLPSEAPTAKSMAKSRLNGKLIPLDVEIPSGEWRLIDAGSRNKEVARAQ